MSTACLSFKRTTAHCSLDLWTDLEEETCECLMKVDRHSLQGGEGEKGVGGNEPIVYVKVA